MEMIKNKMTAEELGSVYSECTEANEATKEANDMLDMVEGMIDMLNNTLDVNKLKSNRIKSKMQKVIAKL